MTRTFPDALRHGEIRQLFPDVYFVTGTLVFPGGPVKMTFSRNMTIIREGERLILINTVRLNEAGLSALDKLGKVTDVIRLAAFHGMDDPFYKERYGAKVWMVRGQTYFTGFDAKTPNTYFDADVLADATTALPIRDSSLYIIGSKPPEGLLVIGREGGIVVAGDCLQHWKTPDEYFNLAAKVTMRMAGFIKPHAIGPGWLKQTHPPKTELTGILSLPFEHVLPAHGLPVINGAKTSYRPAIERAAR